MSIRESQSQHSSILSNASQDPVQIHQTSIIMKPIFQVCFNSIMPEFIYLIARSAVIFMIWHYLEVYTEEDGTVITSSTLILINLINKVVGDSFIEAGSQFMNRSLELKQYNASKVYFAYTYIVGTFLTLLFSLGLLLGLKNQFAQFVLRQQFTQQQSTFYQWVVILYALFYFQVASRKMLRVEGLFNINLTMATGFIVTQLYIVTMQIFLSQMLVKKITVLSFIPTIIGPIIIFAFVQICMVFHLKSKSIKYSNIHFVQKTLFKPFRPKVLGDILKNTCYYVLLNFGDALIYLLTFSVITQEEEYTVVAHSILFIELTNALNKSITITMDSAFRINMQLKRYDRVYQFFTSAFVFFFVNLGYQIITFALRNQIYKEVFFGQFDETFEFYHCSLDGLLGTFNAYTMAVVRSESNFKVGTVIGVFKVVLAIGFWAIGKYTNNGNSHFSTMINFYKYCVDIIGFGFYILVFIKFHKLRKFNVQEEQVNDVSVKPPKLVLQQMQPIDPISRNSTEDSKSKDQSKESKEATTSKDITKSSKLDLIQSQSWTGDEGKDGKALFGKEE
ncbi:MatE_and transmembrane domain-containing protein [Hexamita inflata]|uniref:MatE and transmembrane domain-containing protein n=1 Tax=Hexamita inflata TaxID=28002 RepID=A0AA86R4V2_9EUKA|nr:MatE and transmembrane domain-containing protein [Hexamita inflata]CAI9970590.1 MatE and transmembrane domain-containing protein [Hexamita inflata]